MPSFPDTAVLVILALLLFGPKKLPVLARQLGKLMSDFRRASNEFRTQMEEELRISEQADRQKQIAAIEASAPPSPAIDASADSNAESEAAHVPPPAPSFVSTSESESESRSAYPEEHPAEGEHPTDSHIDFTFTPAPSPAPLPIATSGELSILPPSTGLPIANGGSPIANTSPAESDMTGSVRPHEAELETETLHG
jgi:sec-independent protein translocase protein TatB